MGSTPRASFEFAFQDAQSASGVISLLATLTKANEHLVFCPIQSLRSFPLHYLKIKGFSQPKEESQVLLKKILSPISRA